MATTANDKTATCEITVSAPVITGSFYMVCQSESGWVPEQSVSFAFSEDGTCIMTNTDTKSGTYKVEEGVITMTFDAKVYYATIDGKIMWLFENKADANDTAKSIQHFYNGTEITTSDRAKMIAVFGDGVISGDKPKQENVAGQTLVCTEVTGDNIDADTLAVYKESYIGSTIVFNVDGTFVITMDTAVQTGTYTQNGNSVTLNITTLTNNGTPIDGFKPATVTCTYDGTNLIMPNQIMQYNLELTYTAQSKDKA